MLSVDINSLGMEKRRERVSGAMTIYGHGGFVSLYQIKTAGKSKAGLRKNT